MTHPINPAFQEALRQLGQPTTPEDLSRRGVTQVRSIKSTQIALLIERAVNRTLMERTIGPLDEQEMAVILHDAQNQFTRQLKDFEDLADAKASIASQREDMQTDLARMRSAWSSSRPEAAALANPALTEELRRRLSLEIVTCLAPLLPDGRVVGTGREVADKLRELVETHVAAALEEQRRQFEIEIDIQMRRVAKLMDFLERTEQVLERVAASKDLEHGIESMYRTVQGLAPGDEHYEMKKRMLDRLFETNESPNGIDEPPATGGLKAS